MNPISANDPLAQSANLVAENIAKLKALFPELVTEGANGASVNIDVLKQLVGDQTVTDVEEKFGLNWHGKRQARKLALMPSLGTLRPNFSTSLKWETARNLLIRGENLECLKLLHKSLASSVKFIYIDPPYNTGKDFVYKDNFRTTKVDYTIQTGQIDESGGTLTSNPESGGRFHTNWLNMLYPRVKLARDLLADDGVIAVSIDEKEFHHLRNLLDDVFGPECYAGEIIWKNSSKNDQDYISIQHEYIAFYVKSKSHNKGNWIEKKQGLDDIYAAFDGFRSKHGDNWKAIHASALDWFKQFPESHPTSGSKHYTWMDERGVYFPDNISGPNHGQYVYEVIHPVTKIPCKSPASGWRYPEETMKDRIANGLVHFGDDHTTVPNNKTYLKDTEFQSIGSVRFKDGRVASKNLTRLLGENVFTNPKDPLFLCDILATIGIGGNDTVVDFFSGSGTTAEAVLRLNEKNGSNCRFICIQYPEDLRATLQSATGGAKATIQRAIDFLTNRSCEPTVFEIGRIRIHKCFEEMASASPIFASESGFRVFHLDASNLTTWDPTTAPSAESLSAFLDHIKPDRSNDDVLYEILLKLGLDLCVPIQTRTIAGHQVQAVGGGVLVACLSKSISVEQVEALSHGIVTWHQELKPAADTTCIFRDTAFQNDVAKSNLAAILTQNGIATVRSL